MPYHDLVIQDGDHVILYLPNKRLLGAVEKLFQVSATFF
jgi:trk system potassium uptake protein TrkA